MLVSCYIPASKEGEKGGDIEIEGKRGTEGASYRFSRSTMFFARFCAYEIISTNKYANAARLSSAFLLRFRLRS
jgi:hypothetical protein